MPLKIRPEQPQIVDTWEGALQPNVHPVKARASQSMNIYPAQQRFAVETYSHRRRK